MGNLFDLEKLSTMTNTDVYIIKEEIHTKF